MHQHTHTCKDTNTHAHAHAGDFYKAFRHLTGFSCNLQRCHIFRRLWATYIRDVQMVVASPSSRPTAHLLVSVKIYSSPRCSQLTCHVLLYSARLIKAETSDLVPRNNHPCSEVHSADLFQFQFFLSWLPKMLKVKTHALCICML